MTFLFKGFFVNSYNNSIIELANQKWSDLKIKQIQEPFEGFVGAYSDVRFESYEHVIEFENNNLERELPEFSRGFPGEIFVFICANCFGGDCNYYGYVCKNGLKIFEIEDDETNDKKIETEKLKSLVKYLKLELNEQGMFSPLTRGFFNNNY